MGLLWTCLNNLSVLLEPSEREAVLGDLRERGATPSDLPDLIGLVTRRQIGALCTAPPWLLTVALFLPSAYGTVVALMATELLRAAHFDQLFFACVSGACLLAWSSGYSLGVLGRWKGGGAFVALGALMIPAAWSIATTALLNMWALSALAVLVLVATPGLIGFAVALRGFQPRWWQIVALSLIGLGSAAVILPLVRHGHWTMLRAIITAMGLWPLAYPLKSLFASRQNSNR